MRSLNTLALGLCLSSALLDTAVAQVCDLTTIYGSNAGGNVGGAMYFNLVVTQPLAITGFDVNTSTAIGTPIGLQVWTTPNQYSGQILTPSAWTQIGQDDGSGVSAGQDQPSSIPLNGVAVLQPGNYGMALVAVGFAHRFTIGTPANQSYTNACLTYNAGAHGNTPFATGIVTPRVFNGTIRCRAAIGTFADFTSSLAAGPTPLTVSFSDTSYTSSAGGIVSSL